MALYWLYYLVEADYLLGAKPFVWSILTYHQLTHNKYIWAKIWSKYTRFQQKLIKHIYSGGIE